MPRIAVFAGSFDPVHFGHIEIVHNANKLFDKVYWLLAVNSEKKTMFSKELRLKWMNRVKEYEEWDNVIVDSFNGFTIEYAEQVGAKWLVRSMRNGMDFEYERVIEATNNVLNGSIRTIYIPVSQNLSHVSSSVVRELLKAGYNSKLGSYMPSILLEGSDK